ncbi:MAG TPA: hypothetical protein PKC47_04345 [Petrimonas sp.]|nr:hypothetical protein [Petrimonas sp.]
MKTYRLRSNKSTEQRLPPELKDLHVTIDDLIPIPTKKKHSYTELTGFLDYTDYAPDWEQPMKEEYDILYKRKGNKSVDFFRVNGTELIVMPGTYLYTTVLTRKDMDTMNR